MDAELMAEIGREMERLEDLAADLRAENAKLREALEKISEQYSRPKSGMTDFGESEHYKWNLIRCRDIAKEALK